MPVTFTNQERQNLLNALQIGRNNAIGAIPLCRTLGYPTNRNQVVLRRLIKECIEHDNDLICASTGKPAGFFITNTLAELERYTDTLEGITRSNNERRTALINA